MIETELKSLLLIVSGMMTLVEPFIASVAGVQGSYTPYFPKGLSNMQIKLPDRVLFKISGTPTNCNYFQIYSFQSSMYGTLKFLTGPLKFVSEVLKGS